MPYIDVTVDVDLDSFDDQELIDELENRGWIVSDEKGKEILDFSDYEMDFIVDLVINCKPGTTGREIYEKLKKR